MPHVSVKLYPGRSEQQKQQLADDIAEAVKRTTGSGDASISASIEEVQPGEWMEKVYRPEITAKPAILYKKPGYSQV
jgi:4-oxalocrotonate tautomerase